MQEDEDRLWWPWLVGASVAIFSIWSAWPFLVSRWIGLGAWKPLAQYGQFGDMFGALNALFSGLAFGGVVVAIFLQRKDIHLTQIELRRQAAAQEQSQAALTEQAELANKTAQIHGITTLLDHLKTLQGVASRDSSQAGIERAHALAKTRIRWAEQLEELIDELQSDPSRNPTSFSGDDLEE